VRTHALKVAGMNLGRGEAFPALSCRAAGAGEGSSEPRGVGRAVAGTAFCISNGCRQRAKRVFLEGQLKKILA
jgi:hypothetical protein